MYIVMVYDEVSGDFIPAKTPKGTVISSASWADAAEKATMLQRTFGFQAKVEYRTARQPRRRRGYP